MSNLNQLGTVCVSTKTTDATEEDHEVLGMSQDTLEALRRQNPFLYHSIPAVHKASMALEEFHLSEETETSPVIVSRKTRLTTECHSNLHAEEILHDGELFQAYDEDSEPDPSDALDLFLLLGALNHDSNNAASNADNQEMTQ